MSAPGTQSAGSRQSFGGLLGNSRSSVERLPALRAAFERAGVACAEDLLSLSAAPAKMTLQQIAGGTAEDRLGPHASTSAIGVLGAPGWSTRLVMCAPPDVVFLLVEMALGGDGTQPAFTADRPLTAIEIQVAGLLFAAVGRSLAAAFVPVAETAIALESTNGIFEFEVIGKGDEVVTATFRLEALGRSGDVLVAIPRAAVDAMGKALAKTPPKPTVPIDTRWMQHIQKEVTRTSVRLSATLEERMGTLGEITDLRVGQVVGLSATAHSRVQVECNGERLMWCHLGKSNDFYTLRVDSFVDREQQFMDDILAA